MGSDAGPDVIVIGAGHAGCEAAFAASRVGARVLLISGNLGSIAAMPCNCSIGGPAKAHLVREIDALGGRMGRNADRAYTHVRMLNTTKGPAVQALRAQVDKSLYGRSMKRGLEAEQRISLFQGEVIRIEPDQPRAGELLVTVRDGSAFVARKVVVATGTFLNGVVHVGQQSFEAGRAGEPPSVELAAHLRALGCLRVV